MNLNVGELSINLQRLRRLLGHSSALLGASKRGRDGKTKQHLKPEARSTSMAAYRPRNPVAEVRDFRGPFLGIATGAGSGHRLLVRRDGSSCLVSCSVTIGWLKLRKKRDLGRRLRPGNNSSVDGVLVLGIAYGVAYTGLCVRTAQYSVASASRSCGKDRCPVASFYRSIWQALF
ncbi:hypothetical protein V8C43DRAFT_277882 [Trichoderma afarasin]